MERQGESGLEMKRGCTNGGEMRELSKFRSWEREKSGRDQKGVGPSERDMRQGVGNQVME